VALAIVHLLEMVEVHHDDGDRLGRRDRLLEGSHRCASIRQACQRVRESRIARAKQRPAKFEVHDYGPPQGSHDGDRLNVIQSRDRGHHAKTAKGVSLRIQQRHAKIGTDVRCPGHERVGLEARVRCRVLDNKGAAWIQDRVSAEGVITVRLGDAQTMACLKPLALGVYQRDGTHRATREASCERYEIVKSFFAGCVENVVRPECSQTLGLGRRQPCRWHDMLHPWCRDNTDASLGFLELVATFT
jgi:hypothetical protein